MAHIQIDDIDPLIAYDVSTSRSSFPVPFAYFENANLVVTVGDDILVLDTDYTVSGTSVDAGFSSGTVTLDTAVTSTTVTIARVLPIKRTTDFPNSGPFSITSLNTEHDKFVAIMQQLAVGQENFADDIAAARDLFETLINTDATVTLFATRTAITLASVESTVSYIRTAGYATVGDGGHALYKKIATPSPVQLWHVSTANGVYFELVPGDALSVRQLGAKADASTDDTAAIQAGCDYVGQSHLGGVVILPPGRMKTSATITISAGIIVRGAGIGVDNTNVGGTQIYAATTDQDVINVTAEAGVILEDFSIGYSATQTAGRGISIGASGTNTNLHSRVNRLRIERAFHAIYFRRVAMSNITNCYITDPVDGAIMLIGEGNGFASDGCGDIFIAHNQIWAQNTTPYALIRVLRGDTIVITENKLLGGSRGIDLTCSRADTGTLTITSNSIEQTPVNAITMAHASSSYTFGNVIISNNELSVLSLAISGSPIVVGAGSGGTAWLSNLVVTGNVLNYATTGTAPMISINGTAAYDISGNILNNLGVAGPSGIETGSQNVDGIIANNRFRGFTNDKFYAQLLGTPTLIDFATGILFANLQNAGANGSMVYVSDGAPNTSPMTGSSTGAIAKRLNGAWRSD